jgi:hypothetical protein
MSLCAAHVRLWGQSVYCQRTELARAIVPDGLVSSAGQAIDVSILCSRFRIARIQGVNALLPHAHKRAGG